MVMLSPASITVPCALITMHDKQFLCIGGYTLCTPCESDTPMLYVTAVLSSFLPCCLQFIRTVVRGDYARLDVPALV